MAQGGCKEAGTAGLLVLHGGREGATAADHAATVAARLAHQQLYLAPQFVPLRLKQVAARGQKRRRKVGEEDWSV